MHREMDYREVDRRETGPRCHVGGEELGEAALTADPDLLALRSAAMREKEAFLTYRHYGLTIADRRLSEFFHHEAMDEAGHFIELNRMLARLDPVQAEEFRHHDLDFLVDGAMGDPRLSRWSSEAKVRDPEKWLDALKESIDLEYYALNIYQEDAARAVHPEVKELLTRIMNHEKDDLAAFIHELYRLLHRR
ncbi:MAG: ferritin-like domain-containing protein [Bacillota bacterium]|nr:ferritin-like domain-containing protein [Bacillota bacterium]